jgi:hypothetical protein
VNGKDYAVSTLEGPDLSEHRRKELALVRLMGRSDGRIRHTGVATTGSPLRIDRPRLLTSERQRQMELQKGPLSRAKNLDEPN